MRAAIIAAALLASAGVAQAQDRPSGSLPSGEVRALMAFCPEVGDTSAATIGNGRSGPAFCLAMLRRASVHLHGGGRWRCVQPAEQSPCSVPVNGPGMCRKRISVRRFWRLQLSLELEMQGREAGC